ncbi:hypothetical protein [Streptomyces sp. NPDC053048]
MTQRIQVGRVYIEGDLGGALVAALLLAVLLAIIGTAVWLAISGAS